MTLTQTAVSPFRSTLRKIGLTIIATVLVAVPAVGGAVAFANDGNISLPEPAEPYVEIGEEGTPIVITDPTEGMTWEVITEDLTGTTYAFTVNGEVQDGYTLPWGTSRYYYLNGTYSNDTATFISHPEAPTLTETDGSTLPEVVFPETENIVWESYRSHLSDGSVSYYVSARPAVGFRFYELDTRAEWTLTGEHNLSVLSTDIYSSVLFYPNANHSLAPTYRTNPITGVEWEVREQHTLTEWRYVFVAHAQEGYIFRDGSTVQEYGTAAPRSVGIEIPRPQDEPVLSGLDVPDEFPTYTVEQVANTTYTETVDELDEQTKLVVINYTADSGYYFTNPYTGEATTDYTVSFHLYKNPAATIVFPEAPTVEVVDGEAPKLILPEVEGVRYVVSAEHIDWVSLSYLFIVRAEAEEGYALTAGAETSWVFSAQNEMTLKPSAPAVVPETPTGHKAEDLTLPTGVEGLTYTFTGVAPAQTGTIFTVEVRAEEGYYINGIVGTYNEGDEKFLQTIYLTVPFTWVEFTPHLFYQREFVKEPTIDDPTATVRFFVVLPEPHDGFSYEFADPSIESWEEYVSHDWRLPFSPKNGFPDIKVNVPEGVRTTSLSYIEETGILEILWGSDAHFIACEDGSYYGWHTDGDCSIPLEEEEPPAEEPPVEEPPAEEPPVEEPPAEEPPAEEPVDEEEPVEEEDTPEPVVPDTPKQEAPPTVSSNPVFSTAASPAGLMVSFGVLLLLAGATLAYKARRAKGTDN